MKAMITLMFCALLAFHKTASADEYDTVRYRIIAAAKCFIVTDHIDNVTIRLAKEVDGKVIVVGEIYPETCKNNGRLFYKSEFIKVLGRIKMDKFYLWCDVDGSQENRINMNESKFRRQSCED